MKPLHTGRLFVYSALAMLLAGLILGCSASMVYLLPEYMCDNLSFVSLRPMHVSAVLFWILLGASGMVYSAWAPEHPKSWQTRISYAHWALWVIAIAGIFGSYLTGHFGGREYWEFPPAWSLLIALGWLLFAVAHFSMARRIKSWPVYMWMWSTGIVMFLLIFIENYLWVLPSFRGHLVTDMTIQWKANGSIVGAWNQLVYGTALYVASRYDTHAVLRSRTAFALYFLGLFNLMFNWSHHIYTLPVSPVVKYIGYGVSMTEWILFLRIMFLWRKSREETTGRAQHPVFMFLRASEIWVAISLGHALLMSIPALNLYTHGTHVTVAHAMGTTIGINTMILLSAVVHFLRLHETGSWTLTDRRLFRSMQVSLLIFWLTLNAAGVVRGLWQLSPERSSFSSMMNDSAPLFTVFVLSGLSLATSLVWLLARTLRVRVRAVPGRVDGKV